MNLWFQGLGVGNADKEIVQSIHVMVTTNGSRNKENCGKSTRTEETFFVAGLP